MSDTDRATRFVEKLRSDTLAGNVEWRQRAIGGVSAEVIGTPYVCNLQEQNIGIYEYSYRYYTDEDEFTLRNDVAVVMLDRDLDVTWTLPAVRESWALLDAVKYRLSGAEQFLKSYLNE